MYLLVFSSQKKQANTNFNLAQINFWCISYNQYIRSKIKNKVWMKAINYACFKLEEKIIKRFKKNKSIFINIIGDKFTMSIR